VVDIPLSPAYYLRTQEGLDAARLVNMIYEKTPQGPFPSALIPRPPLVQDAAIAAAAIRAMYKVNGVLNGDTLSVCGNALYDQGTPIGTLGTSSGRCEIDASSSQVGVMDATAGAVWWHDGSGFHQVTDADLPVTSSFAFYAGRWYFAKNGTGTFYWSALDDISTIDGLAFSDTEASPDKIVRIAVLGDDLVFFGANSVEFWYSSGDANQPVQRYTNRTFSRGCLSADTVVHCDNTLMWIGDDMIPYRAESVPVPLVNPETGAGYGIVELIKNAAFSGTAIHCWGMTYDAHVYYAINIGGTNYVLDITTGSWSEWDIETTHCANQGDPHLGGPSGIIYKPEPTMGGHDSNTGAYNRIGSAFVQVDDEPIRCDQVTLLVKAPAEANVSMRYWDNPNDGWSTWATVASVNRTAAWRRQGLIQPPGRRFEFECSDSQWVNFVGVKLNPRRA